MQLGDANSCGSSVMSGVLTVGAGPSDIIRMISGTNPATPVGGQAASPFAVMVVAAAGMTPVAGARVRFTSSPAVAFSVCAGTASCTVLSDQSGMASTFMTVLSANVMTLTAKLAPSSYANPQQVQATLLGVSSQPDLSLTTPTVWVAQRATVSVPVTARVLANGNPVGAGTLNYQITRGAGTLRALAAQTDSNGYATVNLQLSSVSAAVQVSICVAPNNSPCQIFNATVVATFSLQLQPVAGRRSQPPDRAFDKSWCGLLILPVRRMECLAPASCFRVTPDACRKTSRSSGREGRDFATGDAGDSGQVTGHGAIGRERAGEFSAVSGRDFGQCRGCGYGDCREHQLAICGAAVGP